MAGTEAADWWDYFISGKRQNFASDNPNLLYFNNSTNDTLTNQLIQGSAKEATSQAYFGRINYDYKSMLLFQFNARRDGESNFGPNFKWGNFYSGSFGFKFTELQVVKDLNIFSFGKVRVGYGQTGQFPVTTYWPYAATILNTQIMNYSFDNKTTSQGYGPVQVQNPDLHWETVDQTNVGIDLGFLKDQLTVSVDYFNKVNDGMIMPQQVNATAGTYLYSAGSTQELGSTGIKNTNPTVNYGSVSNKGVELTLNYKKQFGDLKADFGLNFTYQKNLITKLATDSTVQGGVANEINGVTVSKVGQSIGEFEGFQTNGIFKATDQKIYNNKSKKYVFANQPFVVQGSDTSYAQPSAIAGDARWKDINHDGVINNHDETYLGSYIPPYVFGFSLGLEYKGFDFNAFLQGVSGNKIFNGTLRYENFWQGSLNRGAEFADRYHLPIVYKGVTIDPGNITSNMPDVGGQNWGKSSSLYIQDGSYLRLKNVTLGYTLPASISKMIKIDRLRIYFTGKNLLTFTKYTGYDPEVGNNTGDPKLAGIDLIGYPQSKMYTFGINLDF